MVRRMTAERILRNATQVEEGGTCEASRLTEKGNLYGTKACRKRDQLRNRLSESESQDLEDMGKAKLLQVQWQVGD